MAALEFHVLITLAVLGSLLIPSSCHDHSGLKRKHVALYVFGDSLFDPGNNNYLNTTNNFKVDWFPYGETFFKYPTGRFSDGRLISDFIAEYAKLPFIPAIYPRIDVDYIYGVNFASAGAGALNETRPPGQVIPLNDQLKLFEGVVNNLRHNLGDAETYTLLSEAVYLFSIGGSDYLAPLATNCSYFETHNQEEYVGMVLGNLTNVIKNIYNKGVRKFGISRLPPLGLVPAQRPGNNGTCVHEATSLQLMHNAALPKHLENLKGKLQGLKYSILKLDAYLTKIINNPSKYAKLLYSLSGAKVSRKARVHAVGLVHMEEFLAVEAREVCPSIDYVTSLKSVFFDSLHPTEKVYQQVSELWWNQAYASDAKEPYSSLKKLFEV